MKMCHIYFSISWNPLLNQEKLRGPMSHIMVVLWILQTYYLNTTLKYLPLCSDSTQTEIFHSLHFLGAKITNAKNKQILKHTMLQLIQFTI